MWVWDWTVSGVLGHSLRLDANSPVPILWLNRTLCFPVQPHFTMKTAKIRKMAPWRRDRGAACHTHSETFRIHSQIKAFDSQHMETRARAQARLQVPAYKSELGSQKVKEVG